MSKKIPGANGFDSTLTFVNDGYKFIMNICERLQTDIFKTRLLLKKTICIKGEEAAKVFYNTNLFERKGVAPNLVKATLFGEGGVQGLDNPEHYHRKQLFMSIMGREGIQNLCFLAEKNWNRYAAKWSDMNQVVLFTEANEILCRSVCEWMGIPLADDEVAARTGDFAAMIDGTGTIGKRHWKGRMARKRSEKWIENRVEKIRNTEINGTEGSVLHRFATHRDLEGKLPDKNTAAVEIINVLRPTVAVSRYIVFMALALHKRPEYREKILNDPEMLTHFVQEVRRFFPFFPFVAAKVRKNFKWRGYKFPRGRRVLLDLYGTNHDPRIWDHPGKFYPERFIGRENGSYDLIPQGGGSFEHNHRCAGELITIELMKVAAKFLSDAIEFYVPEQDFRINLSRIPAIPNSRFIMQNIRQKVHA